MPVETLDIEHGIPESLSRLAALLETRSHLLALDGDAELARGALEATKEIFDLGLSLESKSHPHLHPFIIEALEPPAASLRSSTRAKAEAAKDKEDVDPIEMLPYTPLSVLTTEGLDAEQIWAQLELRAEGISKVAKAFGSGDVEGDEDGEDAEGEEDDSEEDDEEDSTEDMSVEEWKQMMLEQGYQEGDSDDDEDSEVDDEDESGSDEIEDEDVSGDDALLDSDEELEMGSDDDEDEEGDEDEDEDSEGDKGEDDDESGGDLDDADADSDSDPYAAGPSQPRKKHSHPTLDDEFFSIDEFNRLTEEQEASRVTSGRLGGDDEDEDEFGGDVSAMFLEEGDEEDDVMYADFFDVPKRSTPAPPTGKKGKGKSSKAKVARFADDDNDGEDEETSDEDEARGVMNRVKGDLFEDDEEDEDEGKTLSTHEQRQLELAKQIAELEQAAIGPKDWTLLGEATARARPENSLLEEHLDFEQVAKVVPEITEDTVRTLEELIKRRIMDNQFDSPVRVRAFEPTPFLPSRFFELQDTQSTKSLAQIYEDDFQAAATGGKTRDPRDEKLRKEHEEIDRLWGEVSYKLDALSSLNFVPKQPKAQITTIDNLPTTTLESALPPTAAATTLLAPQELFAAPSSSALVARSEQTPEEAQRARSKARKQRKGERQKLDDMAKLYGKKRKTVREEKEEALKGLVKTGKGVTVVGKGDKEDVKRRRRDEVAPTDSKRLKL